MSKKSRSEGNRVAMAIKANKSSYYISDVDLEDNVADVSASLISIRKTLGKVSAGFLIISAGFLIISAGITNLIVAVDTTGKDLSALEWLRASVQGITTRVEGSEDVATMSVEIDTPFKLKDVVRGLAFAYLRSQGELEEESEEEEYFEI